MFIFLYFVLGLEIVFVFSANVPVGMWGTVPLLNKTPVLTVLEETSFKNNLSKILPANTLLVVFAETSLSVEDFVNTEKSGEKPFPFLREQEITYLQNVENPIQALKRLSSNTLEIPSGKFHIENLPENNQTILIIGLDDQNGNVTQNRFELLKRHDAFINSTYNKIVNKVKNVVAVYSGLTRTITQFQAVAVKPVPNLFITSHVLIRILPTSEYWNPITPLSNVSVSSRNTSSGIAVTLARDSFTLAIYLEVHKISWTIHKVELNSSGNLTFFRVLPAISVYLKNQYFCNNLILKNNSYTLRLAGLLIQPNLMNQKKFTGDVESCEGFFTIPILVGLAISGFFVFVAFIAIDLLMSIKTMDRFNDSTHSIVTTTNLD